MRFIWQNVRKKKHIDLRCFVYVYVCEINIKSNCPSFASVRGDSYSATLPQKSVFLNINEDLEIVLVLKTFEWFCGIINQKKGGASIMANQSVRNHWEYPRKRNDIFRSNPANQEEWFLSFFIAFPNSLHKWRDVEQWTSLSKMERRISVGIFQPK